MFSSIATPAVCRSPARGPHRRCPKCNINPSARNTLAKERNRARDRATRLWRGMRSGTVITDISPRFKYAVKFKRQDNSLCRVRADAYALLIFLLFNPSCGKAQSLPDDFGIR